MDGLDEILSQVTWEWVLIALQRRGWPGQWKRRSTGAIYLRCVFHEEKTPSLALRPSGRFTCYGCGKTGGMLDFCQYLVAYTGFVPELEQIGFLRHFVPPSPFQMVLDLET